MRANWRRDFNQTIARAGIAKRNTLGHEIRQHSFRHTHFTRRAERGEPVLVLKAAGGFSNTKTLERYVEQMVATGTEAASFDWGSLVGGGAEIIDVKGE